MVRSRRLGGPKRLDGRSSQARSVRKIEEEYLTALNHPTDPIIRRQIRHAAELTKTVEIGLHEAIAKGTINAKERVGLGTIQIALNKMLITLGIISEPVRERATTAEERARKKVEPSL